MYKFKIIITFVLVASFLCPLPSHSEMDSASYSIIADTINPGGVFTTGTLYRMEATVGESPVDSTTSTCYTIRGGYQSMDRAQLSMLISDDSLGLGSLSTSQVSSASTTITITTDSESGYTLSISAVSGTSVTAVSDGSITAGQTEYGFGASGSDSLFSDDRSLIARNISSTSTVVTGSQTVLTFKASVASLGSSVANYSQTITLTAANNL